MTIKISTVRQKIAAQIATLSGFHQPKLPPEYLGRITDTIAHKAFGVEVNQVVNVPERQRLTVGVYVQSTVIVKFAYRLRPHDTYPIDYDASFDAVEDVIQKVLASYQALSVGLVPKFTNARHTIPNSLEYIIHELTFSVLHTIPGA